MASTRIGVRILPREVILDTQGRAVEQTLKLADLSVNQCRVGRYVELEIPSDKEDALKKADQIARFVLHNPLIEKFELEVLKGS